MTAQAKELTFKKSFIRLDVSHDAEGNVISEIVLDDEQSLAVTIYELENLYEILKESMQEIQEYRKLVEENTL